MPAKIDWYYHRKGCTTCAKSLHFLEEHSVTIVQTSDARVERYRGRAAVELVRKAEEVWIVRGKDVRYFLLAKAGISNDDLQKLVTGPTGNLRAPTLRRGKKLFIGFHPDHYAAFLK